MSLRKPASASASGSGSASGRGAKHGPGTLAGELRKTSHRRMSSADRQASGKKHRHTDVIVISSDDDDDEGKSNGKKRRKAVNGGAVRLSANPNTIRAAAISALLAVDTDTASHMDAKHSVRKEMPDGSLKCDHEDEDERPAPETKIPYENYNKMQIAHVLYHDYGSHPDEGVCTCMTHPSCWKHPSPYMRIYWCCSSNHENYRMPYLSHSHWCEFYDKKHIMASKQDLEKRGLFPTLSEYIVFRTRGEVPDPGSGMETLYGMYHPGLPKGVFFGPQFWTRHVGMTQTYLEGKRVEKTVFDDPNLLFDAVFAQQQNSPYSDEGRNAALARIPEILSRVTLGHLLIRENQGMKLDGNNSLLHGLTIHDGQSDGRSDIDKKVKALAAGAQRAMVRVIAKLQHRVKATGVIDKIFSFLTPLRGEALAHCLSWRGPSDPLAVSSPLQSYIVRKTAALVLGTKEKSETALEKLRASSASRAYMLRMLTGALGVAAR